MDFRILKYFLMVAQYQNITKAAQMLNITQPTLSRQLLEFEERLDVKLFDRSKKSITLTKEGLLLKRRALELLDLEEKTIQELKHSNEQVAGTITIGCGEFSAMETVAKICKSYNEKFPKVKFHIHTATADVVDEMMEKGLVDIGIFLEPITTQGLDYIRLENPDQFVLTIPYDDPFALKEYVTKEDIKHLPLILPERLGIQSELENWFGKDFKNLNVVMYSNLATNAGIMVSHRLGYFISIEGAIKYWSNDCILQKPLKPKIALHTVIAWKRNLPVSKALSEFINEINAFKA